MRPTRPWRTCPRCPTSWTCSAGDDDLPSVLAETLAVGAKTLWLQLGSWHEEVARDAEAAGLDVVMDRCIKIEHARFHGGLNLAGFNTGVISSKRQITS